MIGKNKDQVFTDLTNRLQANTDIVDVDPGSIARAFCDILAEEFQQFYQELDLNTTMNFVSTAQGQFLDLIGTLLSCARQTSESDTNYRSRITNQVFVVAGANQISVRLKALSIDGVKDVILRPYVKGPGSFAVYVITDDAQTPTMILNKVQDIIDDAKSYGTLAEAKSPILVPIELNLRLIFNDNISEAEKSTVRQATNQTIRSYINSLGLGSTFSLNDILRNVVIANPRIIDVDLYGMKVNNVIQFAKSFSVNWDERIVIQKLEIV